MNAYEIGTQVRDDASFRDPAGVLADPTLVVCTVRKPSGALVTPVVSVDGVGLRHVLIDTDEVGVWWVRWVASGVLVAIIEEDFTVTVSPVLGMPTPIVGQGARRGPCSPWVTRDDVMAVCSVAAAQATTMAATIDAAAVAATEVLYELSGEQFPGICEASVRPCGDPCGCWGAANPGLHWGSWWAPADWGWGWGFDGCGGRSCGCEPLSSVRLGYPVREIVAVTIDGVVVDPALYRVDQWRDLVRTDGGFWPSCQDLAADDDEAGAFVVTYRFGQEAPMVGQQAAAQLACQFFLSVAAPASCILPFGASKIVRQGITIDRGLFASWFAATGAGGWNTGLPLVDAVLTAYNARGLRRRPAVWSPDTRTMPRRVGT